MAITHPSDTSAQSPSADLLFSAQHQRAAINNTRHSKANYIMQSCPPSSSPLKPSPPPQNQQQALRKLRERTLQKPEQPYALHLRPRMLTPASPALRPFSVRHEVDVCHLLPVRSLVDNYLVDFRGVNAPRWPRSYTGTAPSGPRTEPASYI